MGLKGRLARLSSAGEPKRGSIKAGVSPPVAGDADLPGVLRDTDAGSLRVIRHEHRLDTPYGCMTLGSALGCSGEILAALAVDEALNDVLLKDALFLDTETTGLAGGAGTLAFLTGVSWFENDALIVEQYFVDNFGREMPLLLELTKRLASASCVVTFNGKSFDWPLLRNRFVMNRLSVPEQPKHFDLLHSARRILKRRLKSMRLIALEESILGTQRHDDVPGEEIPQIYFDFLATGRFGRLNEVLEHNHLDLLAMPALVGWLTEVYTCLDRPHGEKQPSQSRPLDWIGVARVAERIGDDKRAKKYAEAAVSAGRSRAAEAEGRIILAHYCHRNGEYELEVTHLEKALALGVDSFHSYLNLRLAITHEHRLKRFDDALRHAVHTVGEEGYLASQKRERRLRSRIDAMSRVA